MSEEMKAKVWEMRIPDLTPAEQLAVTFDRLSYGYDAVLYHDNIRTMTENVSELTERIKQGDSKHLTDWLKEITSEGAVPEETERAKELLEKLAKYKPLAKIEVCERQWRSFTNDRSGSGDMEEQNYNMIDNVLNNGMERSQRESIRKVKNKTPEKVSLKARLTEKKTQLSGRLQESLKNKG